MIQNNPHPFVDALEPLVCHPPSMDKVRIREFEATDGPALSKRARDPDARRRGFALFGHGRFPVLAVLLVFTWGASNVAAAPVEVESAANIALYENCRMPRPTGPDASYRLLGVSPADRVMVFTLRDGEVGGCRSDRGPKIRERAEVRSAWLVKGIPYILRFRAKFTNPAARKWNSIFQIHQNNLNCVMLKLEMRPDGIELYYRDTATQRNNCVDGGDKKRRQIPIYRGRAYDGRWIDMRFDFILSNEDNGRIEVFLDGKSRAVIAGANSLFSPYLKFGLYRIPKVKDGVRVPEGTAMLEIKGIVLQPAKLAPGYPKK